MEEWLKDIACLPTSIATRLVRLNCDFVNPADDVVARMIVGTITREEYLEIEEEIGESYTSEHAVLWFIAHWEMMYWNENPDVETETTHDATDYGNGYLTIPIIPSGVPFATVIWTQAWEDISIIWPITINEIASLRQIHTVSSDFIFSGPHVMGVRV